MSEHRLFLAVITRQKGFSSGVCNNLTEGRGGPSNIDMSNTATDDTERPTVDQDPEERDRYAELNIGDEEFVIYDRENHQAWIQSTVAVAADEMQ
jgi:hypothetical protein